MRQVNARGQPLACLVDARRAVLRAANAKGPRALRRARRRPRRLEAAPRRARRKRRRRPLISASTARPKQRSNGYATRSTRITPRPVIVDTMQRLLRVKDGNDYATGSNATDAVIELARNAKAGGPYASTTAARRDAATSSTRLWGQQPGRRPSTPFSSSGKRSASARWRAKGASARTCPRPS